MHYSTQYTCTCILCTSINFSIIFFSRRTVQQGNNCGRPFVTCPKPRAAQCGFFEWADTNDYGRGGAGVTGKRSSSMAHGGDDAPSAKKRAPPTCSLCHVPGHTKRTCPQK